MTGYTMFLNFTSMPDREHDSEVQVVVDRLKKKLTKERGDGPTSVFPTTTRAFGCSHFNRRNSCRLLGCSHVALSPWKRSEHNL